MKRLALIGVLALVVIGCVVAAGCTSTTTETTTTTTTTSDDQIIGTWVKEDGSSAFVIDTNKIGTYYTVKDDAIDEEISILWTKNSDGTYTLINGNAKATVTLDTVKGQFTTDSGSVFIKGTSDASGTISWGDIKKVVVVIWDSITGKEKGTDLGDGFYGRKSNF